MIAGTQYQHLSFNPRRQGRTDKRQGLGHQFKLKLQQQPPLEQFNPLQNKYERQTREDLREERQIYLDNERNYEGTLSTLSARQREEELLRKMSSDRKKEDIVQRVRKLQNMVLPLVERDREEEEQGEMGWQSKVERKLMRIESSLDAVRKEWEIEMEKKILEVEGQLENRFQQMKARLQ